MPMQSNSKICLNIGQKTKLRRYAGKLMLPRNITKESSIPRKWLQKETEKKDEMNIHIKQK